MAGDAWLACIWKRANEITRRPLSLAQKIQDRPPRGVGHCQEGVALGCHAENICINCYITQTENKPIWSVPLYDVLYQELKKISHACNYPRLSKDTAASKGNEPKRKKVTSGFAESR